MRLKLFSIKGFLIFCLLAGLTTLPSFSFAREPIRTVTAADDIQLANTTNDSFNKSKQLLHNVIYNEHRHELSALFSWTKRIYGAQLPFLINPCAGVEPMTHVKAEKKIPTEREILRMIAAADPG